MEGKQSFGFASLPNTFFEKECMSGNSAVMILSEIKFCFTFIIYFSKEIYE